MEVNDFRRMSVGDPLAPSGPGHAVREPSRPLLAGQLGGQPRPGCLACHGGGGPDACRDPARTRALLPRAALLDVSHLLGCPAVPEGARAGHAAEAAGRRSGGHLARPLKPLLSSRSKAKGVGERFRRPVVQPGLLLPGRQEGAEDDRRDEEAGPGAGLRPAQAEGAGRSGRGRVGGTLGRSVGRGTQPTRPRLSHTRTSVRHACRDSGFRLHLFALKVLG